jgi:hypothetical protein
MPRENNGTTVSRNHYSVPSPFSAPKVITETLKEFSCFLACMNVYLFYAHMDARECDIMFT